ncbi:MAG: hypothetical protein M1133_00525 [Armatimonadetes bacterium]|nr:hypothetical protein [Armatimonadota bacterium]
MKGCTGAMTRGLAVALAAVCLLLMAGPVSAKDASAAVVGTSILAEKVSGGEIDWGRQMIHAAGEAPMPSRNVEPNRAKAFLKAKGFARMAAIANLMLAIGDTVVTYDDRGGDLMERDASLQKRIEGYIQGLEIIRDEKIMAGDGTIAAVRVTVGTRMYGEATPGAVIVGKLAEDAQATMGEKPKQAPLMELPERVRRRNREQGIGPSTRLRTGNREQRGMQNDECRMQNGEGSLASSRPADPNQEPPAPEQVGPFTSLIVDARGYGVLRAISPRIRKLNGDEVWGTVMANPDYAIENGIAAYAESEDAARACGRCGKNPLIVRAVGRGGGKALCDVVVSDESARRILTENSKTGFLDEYKVIFVIDPPAAH